MASVFGKAPSLADLQSLKNEKKKLFRGAYFWYYFRVYYPIIFPTLFIVFMIIALTGWNNIEGHLVLGSILSLLSTIAVLLSFLMIIPWRKHPSTLIIYKALTSIIFSITMILEAMSTNNISCRNYAVVTHLMLLAGESWLTSIALDLYYSLSNPFTSYQANMRRYQLMVWIFSGGISFILFFDEKCQGTFDEGICWVKFTGPGSPCLWGYYLIWIIIMYLGQIYAVVFASYRLNKGLPATLEIRKKTAEETFKCLMIYASYLFVIVIMFAIIASDPSKEHNKNMKNFSLFFLFIIANRGSVDGIVWFMLHDFFRDVEAHNVAVTARRDSTCSIDNAESGTKSIVDTHYENDDDDDDNDEHGSKEKLKDLNKKIKNKMKKTLTDIADVAIAEIDEADLSPQVNMALRQQIVRYVTDGVTEAVSKHGIGGQEGGLSLRKDPAVTKDLQVTQFLLGKEDKLPFKSFASDTFKELRMSEGITDEKYVEILSKPANERLSEGASGAFMFFCGGGEFIVKTIRAREARVLHNSLEILSDYLKENKGSFLCRFLGSYSLTVYDQTFYFVVMLNCFDPKAKINERFDIKGSWVGRSADPVKSSKRCVCRHCNTYFVPSAQEMCNVIVGVHEPNVVLKDNDLQTKISLPPGLASDVVLTLKKDSQLLGRIGVLDYSLLVGVRKWKFEVKISDEDLDLLASSTTGDRSTFKAHSVTGPAVYYLGIVDFLQDWTTSKKIERAFKIYVGRKDPDGLSVMHPKPYMKRFQDKMDQIFDIDSVEKPQSAWKGLEKALEKDSNVKISTGEKVVNNPLTYRGGYTSVQNPIHKPQGFVEENDDDEEYEFNE